MSDVSTRALRLAAGAPTGAATEMHNALAPHRLYVDTPGAAQRLGVSARTLVDYRSRGGGPKWVRIARAVRYRIDWLDEWADAKAVSSTSQETAKAR
jgi:hypothetical protein